MVLQQKVSPHSTPSPVFENWGPVMAYARYESGGWSEARIQPTAPLSLSPGAMALQFGAGVDLDVGK
jgi:branched-chain amino acid aminotransferase